MPLTQGQHFNDRYWIAGLIERGGFGAVYKAWDITLNRPVAIKESYEETAEGQRQFLHEAQLLANLSQPNLPRVIDFFSIPEQGQYLVMEFVDGQTLEELRVLAGERLPEGRTLGWIVQVLDALSYIHTHDPPVIHRDIKPANIKITLADKAHPQGRAMLVDFGVAKAYDPHKRTTLGARAITPGFSPHEQYGQASLNTDARTDIYSLGATLYMLLTGQEPPESISRLLCDALIPPRQLNPSLSPQIEAVILKAMHNDPGLRFQTAEEFKSALNELLPAVAPPPAAVDTPQPPYAPPPQPVNVQPPTPQPQALVNEPPASETAQADSPPYAQRAAQPVAAYPRSGRARKSKPLASPPPASPGLQNASPPVQQPVRPPPRSSVGNPNRSDTHGTPSPVPQPISHPALISSKGFPWKVVFLVTLGWAVGWAINIWFSVIKNAFFSSPYWVIGTLIGGLSMGVWLRQHRFISRWRSVVGIALGWAIPWVVYGIFGWVFFFYIIVGVVIGGGSTVFVLWREKTIHTSLAGLGIFLGWAIAYFISVVTLIVLADPIDSLFNSLFLYAVTLGTIFGSLTGFLGSTVMFWILHHQKLP